MRRRAFLAICMGMAVAGHSPSHYLPSKDTR